MTSLNQDIRYKSSDGDDNPEGLYPFIKPMRLVFNTSDPLPDTGENEWFLLNTLTGDLFQKTLGTWYWVYNFSTGGGGGGLTAIENDGAGVGWFRNILGSTAHFKSVSSAPDEIDILDLSSEIQMTMSPNYVPPLLARFLDSRKIGSAPFAPPPSADSSNGFSIGDLWTQQGAPHPLYVCTNASVGAAVWENIAPFGAISLGATGIDIYAGETLITGKKTFQIRKINGVAGQIITYITGGGSAEIGINNTYKPSTLALVDNVKNSFSGSLFPPTVSTDSTQGYQKGSIYTQISTVPDAGHIWVCSDATAGSAQWKDVSASPTVLSFDYINWTNDAGYIQTITGGNQDWNAGPTIITQASYPSTIWSSSFDGTRQIFTKGTTSTIKAYHVDFSMDFGDFFGSRTTQAVYNVFMVRKSDGFVYRASTCRGQLPPTTDNNAYGSMSHGFIFQESTLTPTSYYFRISGPAGHNITVERWSIAINEV